jgi:hypothetical protein
MDGEMERNKRSGSAEENKRSGVSRAWSEWSEDEALALLKRAEIASEALAELGRNPAAMRSRKVMLALAIHPRTPRRMSLAILKRMFTFDLVAVSLAPRAPALVKRGAEAEIRNRIEALSLGEKLALARRAPPRVLERLLGEAHTRVIEIALNSPRLTEASLTRALMSPAAAEPLFRRASAHPKWSGRQEVALALLRSEKTPLDRALRLAGAFQADRLSELVPESRRTLLLDAARSS